MTAAVDTARNDAERARLAELLARLSDEDLTRPLLSGEWTVADTLGHLAFYDRRAQVLMEKFLREGVSPAPYEFQSLNDALLPIIERQPPPMYKSKQVTIKFINQLPTVVPSFVFYCNLPQYIKPAYARFLENRLRELYSFSGVPIRMFFRKK